MGTAVSPIFILPPHSSPFEPHKHGPLPRGTTSCRLAGQRLARVLPGWIATPCRTSAHKRRRAMAEIGYWLSSEEHSPRELVQNAARAEEAGFTWAMISDHYHPWVDRQGQAPFVWSVIGGIAQATQRLPLATGVTAPFLPTHPAILAQAAATAASLMPGRFFLGVGTGENLNEHITGEHWPAYEERAQRLEEAVQIMRQLWKGGLQSYRGRYFTVENARIYSLPEQPPEIMVAAGGPDSA